MIRGAIAFGLVLKIPDKPEGEPDHFKERGVVITTTLAVVIITTVLFGTFMPLVQAWLVPSAPIEEEEEILGSQEHLKSAETASFKGAKNLDDKNFISPDDLSDVGQPILENTNEDHTLSSIKKREKSSDHKTKDNRGISAQKNQRE